MTNMSAIAGNLVVKLREQVTANNDAITSITDVAGTFRNTKKQEMDDSVTGQTEAMKAKHSGVWRVEQAAREDEFANLAAGIREGSALQTGMVIQSNLAKAAITIGQEASEYNGVISTEVANIETMANDIIADQGSETEMQVAFDLVFSGGAA